MTWNPQDNLSLELGLTAIRHEMETRRNNLAVTPLEQLDYDMESDGRFNFIMPDWAPEDWGT